MALLLPFLALLFCVAVDYCRAFYASQVVDAAARSAALYASGTAARDRDTTSAQDAAVQAAVAEGTSLNPPLQAGDVSVTTGANSATVAVSYSFPMFTDYTGLTAPLTIQRTVTVPIAPRPPWETAP
jgi:Flp pilus assembly protein TadG